MPARVALFLVDEANEFQRLLRADAEAAAAAAGLGFEAHFSGIEFATQLSMIGDCLDRTPPPAAILVMCVNDRGLQHVARRAALAGVHVLLLNSCQDDFAGVRAEWPGVAVSIVCPDELETGRIQGRQLLRLLPAGGRVLYLQGRARSLAARDRTAGVMGVIEGQPLELFPLEAGWTARDGRETAATWLRMALRANRRVDLIACQNDMLAQGVLAALETVAEELGRPEIRQIAVTGCDGSPEVGQKMVAAGALRATIVLPRATAPAVEIAARVLKHGVLPPASVLLRATSFPPESELTPLAARAARAAGPIASRSLGSSKPSVVVA